MPTTIDLSAIGRLRRRLDRIGMSPDLGPLMASLMKIIVEDNRKGVLAGTDKDGGYMLAVRYRPLVRGKLRPAHKGAALSADQRNAANARLRYGVAAGLGPHAAGVHNNLTRAEYERLGGPPLAPRRGFSRVITNLKTGYQRVSARVWEAYGYWDQVVSIRGVPFLHAHFTGASAGRGHRVHLPVRDLRGVRPEGMERARKASVNFFRDLIRTSSAA